MWIDSHCHVTADPFGADRDAVLARAWEAGVEALICIGAGYGIEGNAAAVELAGRDPRAFATVGIHPHDAKLLDDAGRERLRAWLAHPRVVAVGECGLDYHYLNSPRDAQRAVLAEQLALARELGLPVSLHVRDDGPRAYDELLEIWRSETRGEVSGVLHCYTHDLAFALRAIASPTRATQAGSLRFPRRPSGARKGASVSTRMRSRGRARATSRSVFAFLKVTIPEKETRRFSSRARVANARSCV